MTGHAVRFAVATKVAPTATAAAGDLVGARSRAIAFGEQFRSKGMTGYGLLFAIATKSLPRET